MNHCVQEDFIFGLTLPAKHRVYCISDLKVLETAAPTSIA